MFELGMSVAECLIEDIRNYRYLTHGNVPVAGQDDDELYRQLLEAMNIMGFSKEEQLGKFSKFPWTADYNASYWAVSFFSV